VHVMSVLAMTPSMSMFSLPSGVHPSRKAVVLMSESLAASVLASVKGMHWLAATDQAAVDLALAYAARIDEALADGEGQEVTKALYLGPHLLNTLRALGGAPAERKALGVEEVVGGKLAKLRAISGGKPA
jgi:hypothetical protein